MNKLMISEIGERINFFEMKSKRIKTNNLIRILNKKFQDYFGKVSVFEIEEVNKLINRTNMSSWFKINDMTYGMFIISQDISKPVNRRVKVKLIEDHNYVCTKDLTPFIKFYVNPDGIYLIESILYETI